MSTFLQILRPDFLLHHALYGSVMVGFVCPLVGIYFLLRRLVFWGIALPQVSTAGIAFAFMLQGLGFHVLSGSGNQEKHLAIISSFLFTGLAILILAILERRGKGISEGRIGVLYALSWAGSILFVAWNAAGETEMLGLLKGEIVSISERDFHAMLDVFGIITACMFFFRKEFLLVSYDRDMAITLGRNVLGWDILLYFIVGLTISLGVMTVGPLVIFGFLVIPPMAALPWARGIISFSLLASFCGGLSAFTGFYVSYTRDLPLGPVIVCVACGVLCISMLTHSIGCRVKKQALLVLDHVAPHQ
ncbi:MAG: metal ABC transporter permease [Elusimicrobia bacterium]|nr:metal ABC transporter permease [Elusimicrobiota bacterium]